jgi:Flp pilus assembly protein TadB
MNDGEVARSIAAFEQALEVDDPAFVRRLDRLERRDAMHAVVVAALLAIGAVLITTGLGATSFIVWALGLAMLVLSVVVDVRYQRRLRRTR